MMPRKPLGLMAMTQAERQSRKREKDQKAISDLSEALYACLGFLEEDDATEQVIAKAKDALKSVGKWNLV
jgi:hypothetical protein